MPCRTQMSIALVCLGALFLLTCCATHRDLMREAAQGHTATVHTLLAHGADGNTRDRDGKTALMLAAFEGHTGTVQVLLANGVQVNTQDKAGATALMLAAARGHTNVVTALLAQGADVNLQHHTGQTALMVAVVGGHGPVTHALLARGADLELHNRARQTAVTIAQARGVAHLLAPQPQPTLPRFGRYHALVIGNNAYAYLPTLQTAVSDAEAVAATLRETYNFAVTVLLNATREQIIVALETMRTTLTEDDNLLIYYAGHGMLDKEAERGYWLPVNAQPDTRVHWLSTMEITGTLNAMAARHVLLVAYSWYAGTLVSNASEGLRSDTEQAMAFLQVVEKRSRTALTSGGLEPVLDSGGGNHSVFSRAFLTTLQENQGIVDGQQLASQITRLVMVNAPQTPAYADIPSAGHEGGDFVFVRQP